MYKQTCNSPSYIILPQNMTIQPTWSLCPVRVHCISADNHTSYTDLTPTCSPAALLAASHWAHHFRDIALIAISPFNSDILRTVFFFFLIWGFPKIVGIPNVHPFYFRISLTNPPFWGFPMVSLWFSLWFGVHPLNVSYGDHDSCTIVAAPLCPTQSLALRKGADVKIPAGWPKTYWF